MTGLVLAGGLSSRFGSDKSRSALPGGPELLERTLRLLASLPGVERTAVSCRAGQAEAMRERMAPLCGPGGLPAAPLIIEDGASGLPPTPLKGLTAALRTLHGPALVLPCDFPLLEPWHILPLLEAREARLAQGGTLLRTAFQHEGGHIDALAAVYEFEALPFLEAALAERRFSLHSVIPAQAQELVPCPDEGAFLNMNTPADYEQALRRRPVPSPSASAPRG